jgi:hypothetical protein
MDNSQKSGIKVVGFGALLLVAGFGIPLFFSSLTLKILLLCGFMGFFSVYFIAGGVHMLRFGDEGEARIGPLRSEKRKANIKRFVSACAVPGAIIVGLIFWEIWARGFRWPS